MRGMASPISLALAVSVLLAPEATRADTLEAPAQVTAGAGGTFSYVCLFRKGAGSDQLAAYSCGGLQNVQGGFSADCFCLPFCRVFAPGDTFSFVVGGSLIDPSLPGLAGALVSLCTSGSVSATTVIMPPPPTGVGEPHVGEASLSSEPNPFSTRTTFRYRLPEPGRVSLRVHDLSGRLVATVVEGVRPAGSHEVAWDLAGAGTPARAGILFARLTTGSRVLTRPLLLVR